MYPGWMVIGTSDPFSDPLAEYEEIVNSARAHSYAAREGLCWLYECENCSSAVTATPGYPFLGVALDPAPWYSAEDPDSEGFLGVIGLAVEGADNSTRQASVTMSTSGTGVIGPTYMGPRALVVRALAVATDECSLQYGLTWLRAQYNTEYNPCGGDMLTFFDCCPCLCPEADTETRLCWARDYDQLGPDEPVCDPTFWPLTYDQLASGPPTDDEWCSWPQNYNRLQIGPPTWTCCVESCVAPYFRQFHNVRVTEGPTVLQRPALHSRGAVAELEFTITCGDPRLHSLPVSAAAQWIEGGDPLMDVETPPPAPSPYPTRTVPSPPVPEVPTFAETWVRSAVPLRGFSDQILPGIRSRVRIRANGTDSGPVRLGLWRGSERIGGYTIPYVAHNTGVVVDGASALAYVNQDFQPLSAFVRDWGGRWPRPLPDLPHGEYLLTVDQDAERPVRLFVDVESVAIGAG